MAKRSKQKKLVTPKTKAVTKPKTQGPASTKSHPWRLCPPGEHWKVTHPLRVPPSRKNPAGYTTTRGGHCHGNPSHKDSIYAVEIGEIASQNFSSLFGLPTPNALGFKNGNSYDDLIRGWTKYWNEVFNPKEPLDPDLVKALIATESGFKPGVIVKVGKTKNRARGLMQVTDETQKILGNPKGELKDQLVHVDQEDMSDPNQNI
ncbi:MAG: transglycosylase SLT domain-containing protein, partial [Bdellovibrionales bacterium]